MENFSKIPYNFKIRAIAWKLGLHPANLKNTKSSDFDRIFVEKAIEEYTNYLKNIDGKKE